MGGNVYNNLAIQHLYHDAHHIAWSLGFTEGPRQWHNRRGCYSLVFLFEW